MHRHGGAFGAVLDVYTEVVTMDADAVKLPSFAEAVSGRRARAHSDHVWAVFFGCGLAARSLRGLTQSTTRNQQRLRWTRSKHPDKISCELVSSRDVLTGSAAKRDASFQHGRGAGTSFRFGFAAGVASEFASALKVAFAAAALSFLRASMRAIASRAACCSAAVASPLGVPSSSKRAPPVARATW